MTRRAPAERVGKALDHLRRGETVLGAALLEALLKDFPTDPAVLGLAGAVALQRGDRPRAVTLLSEALKAAPKDASVHSNLALAYLGLGRLDDAQTHLERATAINPQSPEALTNLGNLRRQRNDLAAAEPFYRRALAIRPDLVEAHQNLAQVLEKLGRPTEALAAVKRALALQPKSADALLTLAGIEDELGNLDASLGATREAIALRPRDHRGHAQLGRTLSAYGRRDEAVAAYRAALALAPQSADLQRILGRFDAEAGSIAERQARFADPATPPEQRLHLGFALGKSLEDAGDYPAAFGYLAEANRLQRATYSYDPAESEAVFAEIEAAFTPELFARRLGTGDPDPTPIFVLGMPRSGTTLVEQILASHPDVKGAGELPLLRELVLASTSKRPIHYDQLLADLGNTGLTRLGRTYIERLRNFSADARYITDKMPGNFLLIGIVALALPNARIIHCVRDPADTAISIWRNFFAAHLGYAYDLGEIGHYHRLYQHLMAHWHRVLPGRIYDISYEALVADQDGETRRLLAWCDLDFRPETLEFHRTERPVHTASAAQVRRPISRGSIGIADRYGALLEPLRAALSGRSIATAPIADSPRQTPNNDQ